MHRLFSGAATALLNGLFFLVLTPLGLVLRLFGVDLLRQRAEPGAPSYWSARAQDTQDNGRIP